MYQQIVEEASREQLRQRRGFLRRMKLFHGLDTVNLTTVAQCCSDIRFGGERGGSGIFTQDQHPCEAHNEGQDQDQAATKEVSISVSSNDLLCKSATLQALLTTRALHTPLHSLRSHTPPFAPQALPGIEPGDCIFLVQSGIVNVRHRPKDGSSDDAPPTRMQAGDVFGVGPKKHSQLLESLMEAAAGRVKAASAEGSSACSNVFASNNQVRRPVLVHRAMHHCPSSNALPYVTIRCGSIPTIRRSICSHLRSAPPHVSVPLCTPTLHPHLCLCAHAGHSHRDVLRHGELRAATLRAATRADRRGTVRRREPAQV